MPADLTNIYDHPAKVIGEWLESLPAPHAERAGGISAVEVLRAHEREKDVTFAALSNDALANLYAAYRQANAATDTAYGRYPALDALSTAVRDLLGLDD